MNDLRQKIINTSMAEKSMKRGFKEVGDLVEELLLNKHPDKWVKLPLNHESGFDFWDEEFQCYVDVKTCRASEFGDNIFIEYIQNTNNGVLSNHWSLDMDDDKNYYLFYFDTTERGFGNWWAINWKEAKAALQTAQHRVRGGYTAVGDIVNANTVACAAGCLVLS